MNRQLLPEWSTVRAVLIAWPYPEGDWGDSYTEIQRCYQQILRSFSQEVATWVLVHPAIETQFKEFNQTLHSVANIHPIVIEYDDTWVRDYGPLSLTTGFLGFQFNGWGNKFSAVRDNSINEQLKDTFGSLEISTLVAEGGALEINDSGVLLANKDCLLDKNRNPDLSEQQILYELAKALGVREFALIENVALSGDDTDGHIDTLARFVNNTDIVYCGNNASHPDRTSLLALERQLQALADKYEWQLTPLPSPVVKEAGSGRVMAASYANFLICNKVVFVPVYDVAEDEVALGIFRDVFPQHRIVPLACRALLAQNGSLHCATMQLAEAAFKRGGDL